MSGMKLTSIGIAKLTAAATATETVTFAKILWGNANGVTPEVTGDETQLVNEIHETAVVSVEVDAEMPNVIRVTGQLETAPTEFTLLEVGIEDADGDLIAYGTHPAQLVPAEGGATQLQYSPTWLIVVSSDLAVAVQFQEPGDFATEEWVTNNFQPLGNYVETVTGTAGVVVEGTAKDRSARADEAWFNSRYRRVDDGAPGVQSLAAGTGIAVSGDAASPVVSFSTPWGDARYRGINDPFPLPSHSHPNATQSAAGFMSGPDKVKLDALGSGLGTGLFEKVAEVRVTSPRDHIDLLNVIGSQLFMLRVTGLRWENSQPGTSTDLKMQVGSNSTLYPDSVSLVQMDHPPDGDIWIGYAFLIRFLNEATKQTQWEDMRSSPFNGLLRIDENRDDADPSYEFEPVRSTAAAENRVRLSPANGARWVDGRATIYAFAP